MRILEFVIPVIIGIWGIWLLHEVQKIYWLLRDIREDLNSKSDILDERIKEIGIDIKKIEYNTSHTKSNYGSQKYYVE